MGSSTLNSHLIKGARLLAPLFGFSFFGFWLMGISFVCRGRSSARRGGSSAVLACGYAFVVAAIFGSPLNAEAATSGRRTACIYYDSSAKAPAYRLGEVYAIMTENLLGHFREVKPKFNAVISYTSGGIGSCSYIIYLGSFYGTEIPKDFLSDVAKTSKPVLWMNYNIWQLEEFMGKSQFAQRYGFSYDKVKSYKTPPVDATKPSFFQRFFYKQGEFTKYYRWDLVKKKAIVSPDLVGITLKGATMVSVAQRNDSDEQTPYIVRKGNFFYVADIPFSFIHESDRYLIITDLLFDFLGLPPRYQKRYALIRIEDIHALYFRDPLLQTVHLLADEKVPYAMTVIPRYVDQLGILDGNIYDVKMSDRPEFLKVLRRARENGASFLIHGYTHQVSGVHSCSGVSAADYEFWDGCGGAALPFANRQWVKTRLNSAIGLFNEAGLDYVGWTTPHYEASQLSYKVIAETFAHTVQRARYMPMDVDASKDKITWTGQFFPYIIYRDYYGQFIWPENLGGMIVLDREFNRDGDQERYGYAQRSVADIKRSLKQLRVIRDAWASFFWHPQMISSTAGLQSLRQIIQAIREEGYEFLDLNHPPKDIL